MVRTFWTERQNNIIGYDIHRKSKERGSKGRLRKIWLMDVIEDREEMGIRNWRRLSQDRMEWAEIVLHALVLQG